MLEVIVLSQDSDFDAILKQSLLSQTSNLILQSTILQFINYIQLKNCHFSRKFIIPKKHILFAADVTRKH